jgi:hypothetical protein
MIAGPGVMRNSRRLVNTSARQNTTHPVRRISMKKIRLLILLIILIAMLLPTSAMASPEDKVTVCHVPPGNPANAHTIVIGASAFDAHFAHGDTLGECEQPGY